MKNLLFCVVACLGLGAWADVVARVDFAKEAGVVHQDREVAFCFRHPRIVRPVSRLNIFLKKASEA